MKQNATICAIGEQNVLNGSLYLRRIDQKRKKGWWKGRRESIEKRRERERIEIERKETKGN